MSYQVGQVAELAGVTVRTLHHYDEIGLLSPGERTHAGYRRYTEADLERLQQIRCYRELGFSLEEMVTAIEFAMEARKVGIRLTPEERFEVFGDFDPDPYAEEAEQRWGDSDAYRESMRRTSSYTKADWQRIQNEAEAWGQRMAALMQAGTPADSPEAMELAEEHRGHISRWFYECSYEIHTGLAAMYVADERFTAHYERIKPGMAQYVHDAIIANAAARQ